MYFELAFTNAMHQLNAGNEDAGILKPFEPEHNVDPGFDPPMVLLNYFIQLFEGSKLCVNGQGAIAFHSTHCQMGRHNRQG